MEVIADESTLMIIQAAILLILFAIFILPVISLVSIFKSSFTPQSKILWIIVVLFIPIVGSMLYFQFGKGQLMDSKSH